jgi:hypothetical protein
MNFRGNLVALTILASGAAYAAERDEAWVRKRIEEIKDSDTNAWRKIPWSASLLEARRLGEREKKPIFLFTHDGNIDTGRC